MLQIAVHHEAPPRLSGAKAFEHGSAEPCDRIVAVDEPHRQARGAGDHTDDVRGVVGRVVDEENLDVAVVERDAESADEFGDVRSFVEGRNDDGQIHGALANRRRKRSSQRIGTRYGATCV